MYHNEDREENNIFQKMARHTKFLLI